MINDKDKELLTQISKNIEEITTQAEETLKGDQDKLKAVKPTLATIKDLTSQITPYLDGTGGFTSNNSTLNAIAKNSVIQLQDLGKNCTELKSFADATTSTINMATDFFDTFKDNPIRKLVSILIGVLLGLVVARITGLDVAQATINVSLPGGMGIFLTGILLGLGSSPTHEVIQILSEFKQGQQAKNTA